MAQKLSFKNDFIHAFNNKAMAQSELESIWAAMSTGNQATWLTHRVNRKDVVGNYTFFDYYMGTFFADNTLDYTTVGLSPTPTDWASRLTPVWQYT